MAKKLPGTTAFKPTPPKKQTVSLSAADSAAPTPFLPAPPAPPAPPAAFVPAVSVAALPLSSADTEDPYAYAREVASNIEKNRIRNASATMQAVLTQYNLMSLYTKVVDYIKDGYDGESISVLIRTTPEYKERFPAMKSLADKGRAISEASYIDYEQQAAGLERRYGLPQGMLMGNVTGLLSNDVSAAELNDRVILASSASLQAPQQLKDTFKNYYGIDAGGLAAYFLDPNVAAPLLEKQYASSVIGAEAVKQGLAVDVYGAESLQNIGITQDQAREGFGVVAGSNALTKGRGDVTTQEELIAGTLGQNVAAKQNIERVAGARVGRFQRGGQYLQTKEGNVGLGTAATR